jgi:hypothetical protein
MGGSPPVCEFWFESTWLKYTSIYLCLFHCFPGFGAPTFTTRLCEVQPEFVFFCSLSKMAQSGFRGVQLRNTMSAFMPKLASAWEEEGVVSAWGYKIWVMVMGPRQVPRSPGPQVCHGMAYRGWLSIHMLGIHIHLFQASHFTSCYIILLDGCRWMPINHTHFSCCLIARLVS